MSKINLYDIGLSARYAQEAAIYGGNFYLARVSAQHDDKGRHTTTNRQLLVLPEGGVVIDTAGMRELQILDADLSKSFYDIEKLAEKCYFKDCRHESEPKCAVRKAIEDGVLAAGRFENYKKLQRGWSSKNAKAQ
ncbi:MAG: putative ribosome biogenesis GTPase RsgA [Pelotomaculum sp. PtaU1.Bin065]|nr:MAG: putative ribosome biogenesis GTPase RsgA [Pelotomaculum sp. PtaU1.Bin065]